MKDSQASFLSINPHHQKGAGLMANTTLFTTLTLVVLCFSLTSLAFTPTTVEVDGRTVPRIDWDTTLKKFQFDNDKFIGQRFTAMCPPTPQKVKADGGGNDVVYPSTHSICLAGLKAGAIDKAGGLVTVQLNPGGAVRAGSAGKGSARTISVVGPTGTDDTNQIYRDHIRQIKWDTKFTATGFAYKQLIGQRFSFNCPPAPSNLRPRYIVGTDSYAFKSLICPAAVHAGKITTEGGMVTVQMNPGTKKLVGSVRNGIETKDGASGLSALSFVANPVTP
jgi:hypothetical protein